MTGTDERLADVTADDELLQRFHDGELEAGAAQALEQRLQQDPLLQQRYLEVQRLGGLLRASADEVSSSLDSEALFARISEGISGQATRQAPAEPDRQAAPSLWKRFVEAPVWMPAAGTLAVAAAVLLTLYQPTGPEQIMGDALPSGQPEQGSEQDTAPAEPNAPEPASPVAQPQLAAAPTSEVVEVDFGENAGTVFEIDLADGTSTTVIWINDDE